jgi:hypothetical protein
MATVASGSALDAATVVPHAEQKRLFAGNSVEQEEQRIIFGTFQRTASDASSPVRR